LIDPTDRSHPIRICTYIVYVLYTSEHMYIYIQVNICTYVQMYIVRTQYVHMYIQVNRCIYKWTYVIYTSEHMYICILYYIQVNICTHVYKWTYVDPRIQLHIRTFVRSVCKWTYVHTHMYIHCVRTICSPFPGDETRNGERNINQNPEWWGDFSQLVKIMKIKFHGISQY